MCHIRKPCTALAPQIGLRLVLLSHSVSHSRTLSTLPSRLGCVLNEFFRNFTCKPRPESGSQRQNLAPECLMCAIFASLQPHWHHRLGYGQCTGQETHALSQPPPPDWLAASAGLSLCLSLTHSRNPSRLGCVQAREYGTYKTVKARLWPWLTGKIPSPALATQIGLRPVLLFGMTVTIMGSIFFALTVLYVHRLP